MKGIKQVFDPNGVKDRQFRWEFLRRSPDYIEAYRKFVSKYGEDACEMRSGPDWLVAESKRQKMQLDIFLPRFEKHLRAFRHKWKIDPTNPKRPTSPFLLERVMWVRDCVSVEDLSGETELTLTIDVRGNISEILKYIEWRIRHEKRERRLIPRKQVRKRFDLFPSYLLAFDLHKAGLNDREIAEHPDMKACAKKQNVQMTVKRVAEYRNKAKYLMLNVQKNTW